MSNVKKLMMTAAAGGGLNVEDVFSTYLYDGNASTQTITNDIDLSGEGGLVWLKRRDGGAAHHLYDTERGATKRLRSDTTAAEDTQSTGLTAFNSDGFNIGSNSNINGGQTKNASWTFRKAPKFFDVVTYTGDGTNGRTISHNLGSAPGCIIVKDLSYSSNWKVYHRGIGETKWLELNNTNSAQTGNENWYDTAPTSSVFTVGVQANNNGSNFVAYLFAHNDGDGEFGPDGDADIIKCGSYTGSGGNTTVDLGFEPQWVMVKAAGTSSNWFMIDNMRGITSGNDPMLYANENSGAESRNYFELTSTGFKAKSTVVDSSGTQYIYIAIRRGPMAVPESADDVFAIDTAGATSPTPPTFNAGFTIDAALMRLGTTSAQDNYISARITNKKKLNTNDNGSEGGESTYSVFDYQEGHGTLNSTLSNYQSWMWRRAPNYFDVVAYTGDGSTQTINHNLGAVPEMMWVKMRNDPSFTRGWIVYHKDLGTDSNNVVLHLDTTAAEEDGAYFNDERPTDTSFKVVGDAYVNRSGANYIAYLFASLDGVSKVGSYTGNGSTTGPSIDCGFSAGPRFVLIKRTDSAENWYVFDSERGIVAGADPYLMLNSTSAEINAGDIIDPTSSGFQLATNGSNVNASGGTYIFYAIA